MNNVIPLNSKDIEAKRRAIQQVIEQLQAIDPAKMNGLFLSYETSENLFSAVGGWTFNLSAYTLALAASFSHQLLQQQFPEEPNHDDCD